MSSNERRVQFIGHIRRPKQTDSSHQHEFSSGNTQKKALKKNFDSNSNSAQQRRRFGSTTTHFQSIGGQSRGASTGSKF